METQLHIVKQFIYNTLKSILSCIINYCWKLRCFLNNGNISIGFLLLNIQNVVFLRIEIGRSVLSHYKILEKTMTLFVPEPTPAPTAAPAKMSCMSTVMCMLTCKNGYTLGGTKSDGCQECSCVVRKFIFKMV